MDIDKVCKMIEFNFSLVESDDFFFKDIKARDWFN